MKEFFSQLKKYSFSNQMLAFWLFGLLIIVQIVFDFLWVQYPLNFIITIALIGFYLVLGRIILTLVDGVSHLDLERNQINAMIQSINDPAISYSKNFEVVLVNPAMEKLTGLTRQEIEGKIISPELTSNARYGFLAKIIFPSLAPKIISRSLSNYPQVTKVKFFKPRELTLEIVTTKVIDRNGKDYGFLKVIHDLTEEENFKKTQSDFITIAAHQLRTPLSGLSWSLEMLLKKEVGPLNAQQEQLISQGKEAVGESLKTVEALLNAAQIAEGRFGYQFTKADIIQIIKEVFTKFIPAAKSRNIKLILYPPQFPLHPFVMDPLRIKLLLEILVDNAIKYNVPNGEVRIRISPIQGKPFINVSVEDTGRGISPKDIPRLFTKFFRSKQVMKEETSGTGLGLYLAKNIVQRHGGEIKVKSVVGRGSTFTFSLPLDPKYIPPE